MKYNRDFWSFLAGVQVMWLLCKIGMTSRYGADFSTTSYAMGVIILSVTILTWLNAARESNGR